MVRDEEWTGIYVEEKVPVLHTTAYCHKKTVVALHFSLYVTPGKGSITCCTSEISVEL
jgi:hypothetical protein